MKNRSASPMKSAVRRFFVTAALAAGVIGLMVALTGSKTAMGAVQTGLARITGAVLTLFGHDTSVTGNTVGSASFSISVVTGCTGIYAIGIFLIAVVLYPTGPASKLFGFLIGIGGIFTINIVRLVSLYYVGIYLPGALESVHLLIWQSLLIVFSVSLWLFWAGRFAGARAE